VTVRPGRPRRPWSNVIPNEGRSPEEGSLRGPRHFWRPGQLCQFVVRASSLHGSNAEVCSQDGYTTNPSRWFALRLGWAKLWCGLPACTAPTPRCAAKMAAPQIRPAGSPFVSAGPNYRGRDPRLPGDPSLRTVRAVLPHTALRSVVLPSRGPTDRCMGCNEREQPMLGKEGVWPALMIAAPATPFAVATASKDAA